MKGFLQDLGESLSAILNKTHSEIEVADNVK